MYPFVVFNGLLINNSACGCTSLQFLARPFLETYTNNHHHLSISLIVLCLNKQRMGGCFGKSKTETKPARNQVDRPDEKTSSQ